MWVLRRGEETDIYVALIARDSPTNKHAKISVVVEVKGFDRPEELVAQLLATTLQSHLRASDPLARIGRTVFAVAMALDSGSMLAPAIEQRLADAVRSALKHGTPQAVVQSAHVLAGPDQQLEVDELLRRALRTLRGD